MLYLADDFFAVHPLLKSHISNEGEANDVSSHPDVHVDIVQSQRLHVEPFAVAAHLLRQRPVAVRLPVGSSDLVATVVALRYHLSRIKKATNVKSWIR